MERVSGSTGGRGRARRRYAAPAGAFAAIRLLGGLLPTRGTGGAHDLGLIACGYGLGVAVAAVFLALGYEPRRHKW